MDKVGTLFGNTAVCLTLMARQGKEIISEKSWKSTIEGFEGKDCYVNKPCPKNTYLSMCSKGLVKGIPEGKYTSSVKNKAYGLLAVDILREDESYKDKPSQLWKKVLKRGKYNESKQHNHQMDVVCALWNAGLIKMN